MHIFAKVKCKPLYFPSRHPAQYSKSPILGQNLYMKQREPSRPIPPVLPLVCPFFYILAHIPPYLPISRHMCPFLQKSRASLQYSNSLFCFQKVLLCLIKTLFSDSIISPKPPFLMFLVTDEWASVTKLGPQWSYLSYIFGFYPKISSNLFPKFHHQP